MLLLVVLLCAQIILASKPVSSPLSVFSELQYEKISWTKLQDLSLLRDWEFNSIPRQNASEAVCKYNGGRSKFAFQATSGLRGCCLGSYSSGGTVHWSASQCSVEYADYGVIPKLPNHQSLRTAIEVLELIGNRTFGVTGDSVMLQMASAMECSWSRSEHKISYINHEAVKLPKLTNEANASPSWKYGVGSRESWTFKFSDSTISPKMILELQYRPYRSLVQLQHLIEQVDILMLNFGLHWNSQSQSDYKIEISAILKFLSNYSDKKIIIWRETSAQHMFSIGGEYPTTYDPDLRVSKE